MEPIIKWAGGKRRFVEQIISTIGDSFESYFEPFLGGAAVLYRINAKKYYCSDVNDELINFYKIVQSNCDELIKTLQIEFVPNHCKSFYLKIRNLDRNVEEFSKLSPTYRAARFLYLNKTCFNGLWRVNKMGQNNVPMGKYKKPNIIDKKNLISASKFFNEHKVNFYNSSFEKICSKAKAGDLVYFDPPYDIEEGQNSFTSYSKSGFNRDSQIRLKKLCDKLILKGVKVAVSNSNTKFINELYSDGEYTTYTIHNNIISSRTIGADPKSRKKITELLIVGKLKDGKTITSGK